VPVTGGLPIFILFILNGYHLKGSIKPVFSGLKINEMALPDQIDFLTFLPLPKMT
jgi:hypothetical protein